MKNLQTLILVLMLGVLMMPQLLCSQNLFSADSIVARINRQVAIFPQEKIYVHNDKPVYISGEKVWFRAHLVNSYFQKYDSTSIYVYGELVNPMDSVVDRVKIRRSNESYSGHFALKEDYPAGTYCMRFYTKYMTNLGDDYFFKKNIEIGGSFSSKYQTDAAYSYTDDGKKLNVTLQFKDAKSGKIISPQKIAISNDQEYFLGSLRAINGKLKTLSLDKDQKASFRLDVKKEPLRSIYVEYEYEGNFHNEFLPINISKEDFHVDFFPEGGNLLSDVEMNIAFKALYADGLATAVTGIIYSDAGDSIKSFKTNHLGMGLFSFKAEGGQQYTAVCKTENGLTKTFDLPQAIADGYTLTVQTTTPDFIQVSLLAANNKPIADNLALFIHSKGQPLYSKSWDSAQETILIPRSLLPTGVIHCMLVNQNYEPISERLFFYRSPDYLPQISLANNKVKYEKRDSVTSKLIFTDMGGKPLNGSFSVSVTDNKDIKIDSTQSILTHLLLTSELRGYIENPSSYFKRGRLALYALDILMQTQGWRRYDMAKVVKGNIEQPQTLYEYSQIISGEVRGGLSFKKAVKDETVNLLITKGGPQIESTTSDQDGRFSFNTDFPDSLSITLSTKNRQGITNILLNVDKDRYPILGKSIPKPLAHRKQFNSYFEKAELKYTTEMGIRMINLKSVEVVAKKKSKSIYSSTMNPLYDADKFKKLGMDENSTLENLLNRLGIWRDEAEFETVYKYNDKPIKIIVDDLEDFVTSDIFVSQDPSIEDIESIEITDNGINPQSKLQKDKPIEANADNDISSSSDKLQKIVLITTKQGNGRARAKLPLNMKKTKPLGYQTTTYFYSPMYETVAKRNDTSLDLRTTLYWNPFVKVENGKAEVSFYTADDPSTYTILLEGLDGDGKPLHLIEDIGDGK